jgi:hypothetical protein
LIQVFTSDFDGPLYGASSYPDYEAFRDVPVFAGLLASMRVRAALSDEGQAEVIDGLLASGNYFAVLGLHPSRGRFFSPEEGRARAAQPVAVLSDQTWRRRFATDPEIIGRSVELNGRAFTVIGIAPRGFAGTGIEDMAEFFVPAAAQDAILPERNLLQNRRARTFRILGVIAFAASQRTREIGVRLALGASNRSVIALIMREGLLLTVIGVVLGTGAALIGRAALSSLLIGIEPFGPVSFGVAIPTLLLVGALASYVPARRASSVDPSVALRRE